MSNSSNSTISTEFSNWIANAGLKVDIYTGIKKLINAVSKQDTGDAEKACLKTGMEFIKSQVRKSLGQYADNIMVEYSLVASTLDPDCPDILQCCSFILAEKEDPSRFIDVMGEKYSKCIEKIRKIEGYSIYEHPHFLYAIPTDPADPTDPDSKIWDNDDGSRSKYILTKVSKKKNNFDKNSGFDNNSENIIPKESDASSYVKIGNDKTYAVGAFPLNRKYSVMVRSAQDWIKKEKNNKDDVVKLRVLQKELHEFCFADITNRANNDITTSYYISFPVYGAPSSNQLPQFVVENESALQGIGACFIYFEPKVEIQDSDNKFVSDISKLVYSIGDTIRFVSVNYLFNLGLQLQKRAKAEAIKSAKAAIMSRNLSHNLGSHVMSYMKQSLTSVEEMVKSGALEQVHKKTETISNEMPFLVGMGKFISYLQERQDYIATVSTDYIPYPSIVNFKDSIYDELNPDYRFQRHSENRKGFQPANLLLENIAKSEGLSRKTLGTKEKQEENNIFINYKDFNGINFQDATDAYNDLRKWNFSLPGGIMGRQAVFSIVENVIRNAAKHGKRNKGDNLTVTFDIIDPLACSDEIRKDSFFNRFLDSSNEDYGDLYIVTLTASTQADEGVIGKIKTAIDDASNPVDDDFNLKQSNKGIKEMFISASWLRSLRIENMAQTDLDKMSPILEVREYKGKLQYVFCLPKVKEVAVVSDSIKVNDDATIGLMRRYGWRVLSYQVYLDPKTKKNYNFVIFDDASKMEEIRKCSHNNFFVASDCTDLREHRIKTKVIEDIKNRAENPITEDCLKEAEIKLYKELSACKDISIAICDIKNIKSYQKNKKNKEAGIEIVENEAAEKTKEYRYFYRTHNDSKEQFKQFINNYGINNFKYNLGFVEGISGGNSTDRLVRHSELDDTWVYKQIHAMRTKVAIFDERIFAKFAGFDPNERTPKKENGWSVRFKDINDVKEARDKIKKYAEECGQPIKDARQKEIMKCKTMDEIVSYAVRYYPLNEGSEEKSIMPLVLNKKGIDVYTLIPESDTNGFEIWGYDADSFSGDNQSINFGEVRKLGVFSLRDENGRWNPEIRMKSNYHQYLTIHQGLLDKIYEKMQDGERDQSNKLKVTQKLYNAFGYGGSTESDWLQGLVIHSGRSKPNTADMPQNQPFIQYSALENAVYDCKYTLVELLDYACFE